MDEVEARGNSNADYTSLVQDCHEAYFSHRLSIIVPSVKATVESLRNEHNSSLPAFVRAGCAYLVRTCVSEFQLYKHFFNVIDNGLIAMLDDVSTVLYDVSRPLFIHSATDFNTLVDLCSILKVEILDDKGLLSMCCTFSI